MSTEAILIKLKCIISELEITIPAWYRLTHEMLDNLKTCLRMLQQSHLFEEINELKRENQELREQVRELREND